MRKTIFKKDRKYTFSDYAEFTNPTKEILEEFGYHYSFEELTLPMTARAAPDLSRLRDTYVRKLPSISLNSEIAKREFYIAPLLLELLDYVPLEINTEYPLDAGENLSGAVDYLLEAENDLLIIDAKKGDLEKGFNQLAAELIALDKVSESDASILYGVVTSGDMWRFGALYRDPKMLKKDMNGYILPRDLASLFAVLLGILEVLNQPAA